MKTLSNLTSVFAKVGIVMAGVLLLFGANAGVARADSLTLSGVMFTIINDNSDGTAALDSTQTLLDITGPNNGSGNPGTIDLVALASATGDVNFDWSYASMDTPAFDYAGYLANGAFVQLADTDGESGTLQLPVTAGQQFGFEVGSLDNQGEPGILTISSFSAPSGSVSGAPEPAAGGLLLMAAALVGVSNRVRASRLFNVLRSSQDLTRGKVQ